MWTAVFAAGFFSIMNKIGRLRIGQAFEIYGLDTIEDAQLKRITTKPDFETLMLLEQRQRNRNIH